MFSGCAAKACRCPQSSMLSLNDDVIILSTGKKIEEISVITSQLVIKVKSFPFHLNLLVAGDRGFKWSFPRSTISDRISSQLECFRGLSDNFSGAAECRREKLFTKA